MDGSGSEFASLGEHFGMIGVAIICLFTGAWIASALGYRLLGYHRLERADS